MAKPITHFSWDLETLGTEHRSVVLAIGITPFRFEEKTSFQELLDKSILIKLDVEEQIKKYGRKLSSDTLAWWRGDDIHPTAKEVLHPSAEDITLIKMSDIVHGFLEKNGVSNKSYHWSRGNVFDFGKIESLFTDIGQAEPYNFGRIRDYRTAIDIMAGVDNGRSPIQGERKGFIPHVANHDSSDDALTIIELYHHLIDPEV